MTLLLLLAWAGCAGNDPALGTSAPTTDPGTKDTSTASTDGTGAAGDTAALGLELVSIEVLPPLNPRQHYVAVLVAETTQPATATMVLSHGDVEREVAFLEPTTHHALPVLGLPAGTHEVAYTFSGDDGLVSGTVSVVIEEPDVLLPRVDVTGDPDAAEPGYTLAGMWSGNYGRLIAFNAHGEPVWMSELPGVPKAVSLGPEGHVGALVERVATVRDVVGTSPGTYGPDGTGAATQVRDQFHHELLVQPDGSFWSLQAVSLEVDAYPTNENRPYEFSPATIADEVVVHYAEDGTLLQEWSMAALLDTRRIGYDAASEVAEGLDWAHGNALFLRDGGAKFVVSLRHQDALVQIDTATGTVDWILANPDGWSAELEALRLQPVGDILWPYHSHGVKIDGDLVYVFDNGNHRRSTPYTDVEEEGSAYSRVVSYRIDEAAGTVEEVWSYIDAGRMYSRAMGNVQVLPTTGHLLATYPFQRGFDGVPNDEAERGEYATRFLELDVADGTEAWGLTLWSTVDEASNGWLVDRATRIPSLYEGLATVTWRAP